MNLPENKCGTEIEKKQIFSLGRTLNSVVDFGFNFAVFFVSISKKGRFMTPDWPPVQNPEFKTMTINSVFHSHVHFEFIYVKSGIFTQHLEDSIITLKAGESILLNSNIRHYEGDETECECIYMNFLPEFLHMLFFENALNLKQHECKSIVQFCFSDNADSNFERAAMQFSLQKDSVLSMNELFEKIFMLLKTEKTGFVFYLQAFLLEFFEQLETTSRITIVQTSSDNASMLFADIKKILFEKNGRISRNELAKILHYNPDYIGRIVHKETGMSFSEYSQSIWLEKAKHLLASTDLSIREIIFQLGYNSENMFYRVFQKKVGKTPKDFRKEKLKNN